MLLPKIRFALTPIRSALFPFITVFIILIASVAVIAYGRGYRLDFKKTSLTPTGLLSVTSDPIGAQVYVDGNLKTATNNSINLEPNWYTIRITKEGYLAWEKKVRLQGEVVSRADAYLFPTNPSLSPLTTIGIESPQLSPDGTKIAYIVTTTKHDNTTKKAGLWVYELTEGPLGRNRDPQLVGSLDTAFDLISASIQWSPDSSQILAVAPSRQARLPAPGSAATGGQARLYRTGRLDSFQDATYTTQTLLTDWQEERNLKERQKLAAFPQPIIDIATTSAKIIAFSPDETKLFYEATATATIPQGITPALIGTNATQETRQIEPGKLYVYDSREDKNFFVLEKKEIPQPTPAPTSVVAATPPLLPVSWLPTNKHLILTLPGKIDIMEYDRTNWITVYAGPFVEGFLVPWPNASRIVIMTNLNPSAGALPNLYTVNLR